jgi:hypothetical protein
MMEAVKKDQLAALAAKRFEVVGSGDIDATMSILVDDPVFELYPVGLQLAGQADVRRYYEHLFQSPKVRAEHLGTLFADNAIAFELKLTHQPPSGDAEPFRLLAIMEMMDGRFTGERLYGDERLFRILFGGPIWSLLKPVDGLS